MKKILDVNKQRKIRDRKRRKRYFKVFIFMLFFFVTIVCAWEFSIGRFIFKGKRANFPILFSGENVLNFEKNKSGFFILTNNLLNFYRYNGDKISGEFTTSSNIRSSIYEEYMLLYEKDSKNFSIYNNNRLLFSTVLKNKIKFGKIYKNGTFAFITEGDGSFCELIVHNIKNEEIFRWSSAESLVMDFDFLENGQGIILTTSEFEKGLIKTAIYELNFEKNEEIFKKYFNKYIPISIKKNGSVIVLVCDLKTFFIDGSGNILNEIEYEFGVEKFVLTNSGYFILVLSDRNNSKSILFSYDKFGSMLNKLVLEDKVKKIKAIEKEIFLLENNLLLHTNINLNIVDKVELKENIEDFIYIKPYLYYVSMNKIDRFIIN